MPVPPSLVRCVIWRIAPRRTRLSITSWLSEYSVTLTNRQCLTGLALALVAACGDDSAHGDDDAPSSADGGVSASDAGPSPTSALDGAWLWLYTDAGGSSPSLVCSVAISNSIFDVTCPQGRLPREAGTDCTQLRDDLHIYGTLAGRLDGTLDTIVEYDGAACANYGYTSGAPYPLPAFAQMTADHLETLPLGAFLSDLGGRWDYRLIDARNTEADVDCDVRLALPTAGPGVSVEIACPRGVAIEIIPGCSQETFSTISASLRPGELAGELANELRHEGETCGTVYPPVVRELHGTMEAYAAP